jgi:hypothetical protein
MLGKVLLKGWSHLPIHCKKKVGDFPVPSREVWQSLVCDIPAGEGKITNLYYTVLDLYGLEELKMAKIVLLKRSNTVFSNFN